MRELIIAAVLLVGCEAETQTRHTTVNGVQVGFLFEYQGCRVYRFSDEGRYHYYTNCKGGSLTTTFTACHMVGKVLTCREEAQ